jgi:hypothetical protein
MDRAARCVCIVVQPPLIARMLIEVEQRVRLASVAAAEISNLAVGFPRVQAGLFRQHAILGLSQHFVGERPQEDEPRASVAPAGHVFASARMAVVTDTESPSRPASRPGSNTAQADRDDRPIPAAIAAPDERHQFKIAYRIPAQPCAAPE